MGEELKNPVFARFFHRFCGRDRGKGERELRRELLTGVSRQVVEVGAGNGINFEHYPESVSELIAVEPEPYLRSQAEQAVPQARVPERVMRGVAAPLDLPQDSVVVVVVCGVLCSMPDQRQALSAFRRVPRKGGELRFLRARALPPTSLRSLAAMCRLGLATAQGWLPPGSRQGWRGSRRWLSPRAVPPLVVPADSVDLFGRAANPRSRAGKLSDRPIRKQAVGGDRRPDYRNVAFQ
jgi:SAM-dependent methyltransferase